MLSLCLQSIFISINSLSRILDIFYINYIDYNCMEIMNNRDEIIKKGDEYLSKMDYNECE